MWFEEVYGKLDTGTLIYAFDCRTNWFKRYRYHRHLLVVCTFLWVESLLNLQIYNPGPA
uniref:Uncharacterized protein n=1 Tax=Rhizophora mucronata TaxID=61149 RepID=A0A2P2LR23_RHIMU